MSQLATDLMLQLTLAELLFTLSFGLSSPDHRFYQRCNHILGSTKAIPLPSMD